MKAVLRIGYQHFLFESEGAAAKVFTGLCKAKACLVELYRGQITLNTTEDKSEAPLRLDLVPPGTKIITAKPTKGAQE